MAWQVSTDAGRTWRAVEGATSSTYAFTAAASDNGRRYRAEFTNAAGVSRTAPATLTVTSADATAAGGPSDGGTGGTGTAGGAGTTGGSDGGSRGSGGSSGGSGGSSGGTAGTVGAGPSAGTVGGTGSAPTGGVLASTGVAGASLTVCALLLTATGWLLVRRTRPAAR